VGERLVIDRQREFDLFVDGGKVWLTSEDKDYVMIIPMTPDQARMLANALTVEAATCEQK